MSNVNTVSPIKASEIHQVVIEGKVTEVEQPQNSEYTYFTIGMKARDEYSLPPVVQVSQSASQRPFARKDEVVKILCELSGFPRTVNGRRYITNVLTYREMA